MTYELAKKLKDAKGKEKNPRWLGDKAGYASKHQFLTRNFGKPKNCDVCLNEGKVESGGRWSIQWARKQDREYTHQREDYLMLCRMCHGKYDMTENKRAKLIKMAYGQKGSKSEAKSRIAFTRQRDKYGHFIKATA